MAARSHVSILHGSGSGSGSQLLCMREVGVTATSLSLATNSVSMVLKAASMVESTVCSSTRLLKFSSWMCSSVQRKSRTEEKVRVNMRACVQMCVYVYVCVCVCACFGCMHVHMCVSVCVYIYVCVLCMCACRGKVCFPCVFLPALNTVCCSMSTRASCAFPLKREMYQTHAACTQAFSGLPTPRVPPCSGTRDYLLLLPLIIPLWGLKIYGYRDILVHWWHAKLRTAQT